MDNIRIGNTFEVSWAINQFNGTETVPYDLAGKDLTLILANALSKVRVEKFSVIGNIISFTFEGKDQRHAGKYSLILIENNGVDGMHIVDVCDAFRLVNRSCETCDDPSSIVDCTHIDFASTMLSRRGISAYEYAKLNGYEGTEEEYAADCRAIPELKDQVQEIVDKAAEDIQAAIESFDKTLQGKQDTIEDLETIRTGAAKGSTAAQPSDIPKRLPNPLALNYSINGMSGVYTGEQSVYWPSIYAPSSSGAAGYVVEGGKTGVKWTKLSTINGESLLNSEDIVIEENSKIILDFEKLGEPIDGDEEGMEMRYSKEQFENAVGMSMSEFIEKIKTSELVLSEGVSGMNSYCVVADEYTWTGYYKIPRLFNYVLTVDATPSEESFFVGVYDEAADLPFATTEYVDEKHAQTEARITELSEENERLRERIEEQDQFIEDLQNTKIDRENDDYYPMMAVGLADNLAGVDVVDSEINFRRSGGGAITDGVARIESIKGNSVVWNQHWKDGITQGTIDNVSGTANKFVTIGKIPYYTEAINGHKILAMVQGATGDIDMVYFNDSVQINCIGHSIFTAKISNRPEGAPLVARLPQGKSADYSLVILFCDLTKMFGAGNEPTTIEEFYQRAPMGVDLNAYNEGEVIHMDVQSIESVGVNQWDEEWELGKIDNGTGEPVPSSGDIRSKNYIPVIAGATYYCLGAFTIIYYDEKFKQADWWSVGGYRTLTLPQNVHYVKLYTTGTTYNHDICINLSDTSINGKYFPYIKRVEDLAVIRKYFPEGMKSAPTAHDAIRYNKESGKWEKVEAIGIRAYQEGDADNASYLTDGKVTCYPLAEPIVTELDEADQFKDLDYQVWNCGTERANAEGKSAPLAADITYGFNAIGKIKELESLVAALRAKVGI